MDLPWQPWACQLTWSSPWLLRGLCRAVQRFPGHTPQGLDPSAAETPRYFGRASLESRDVDGQV